MKGGDDTYEKASHVKARKRAQFSPRPKGPPAELFLRISPGLQVVASLGGNVRVTPPLYRGVTLCRAIVHWI